MTSEKLFTLDFPGTAVITDDGRTVSYAELKQLTEAWHPEIASRSLVFLLVANNLDSLVAYVACLNRGVVPLMLDAKIDAELLARFESTYRPGFVVNCVSGEVGELGSGEESNNRTIEQSNSSPKLYPELALLLTTSGSTGSPKLVRQTYANIRANTESIVEYLHLDATERPITTLPMNYTYGLSILNSHLSVGATILLTSASIMQREFWDFFTTQGATSFGGVPYTYEMLDKLMFFRRKLPSLRTMTQAGGKILPALHQKFAEYAKREGKSFVVMYGQCEATARMAYLPPERALDKVGSMGIVIPGGKFKLIDVNGNEIPDLQPNNSQSTNQTIPLDRHTCALQKVEEWLAGVDDASFDAALKKLVDEKSEAGEYRFKKQEERELALVGARKFYREFARKIVPLSDGRYVYFTPDERAKTRNASNAISWAEYAFHAVSNGGAKVSGKNYNERWYNPYKQPAFDLIEGVLKQEKCFIRLSAADARFHAIVFAGTEDSSPRLQVVTRLDEAGNIDANPSEVTFTASHKEKKSPRLVPLAEAVRTVVHYQIATGSYPPNKDSIAVSSGGNKGESATPSTKHQALSTGFSEVGELVYEGANVTLGYAECAADLAKGDERHGVLVTGDMAKRDADGFYYIVGRKKRFLKIFGNRVNLDETERLIKSHFTGIDCACSGVDDHMKIYIDRLFDCSDCSIEQKVRDFVAEKTHLNFSAFEVVTIDKIPKNDAGKTLYAQLP